MVALNKILSAGLVFSPFYETVASPDLAAKDHLSYVRYLGGSGPYIQNPGYGISTEVPPQCTVEQVQLLMRHGERFPGLRHGKVMSELVDRLQAYSGVFMGPLAFLKHYKYYAHSEELYEEENTRHNSPGPYIGEVTCKRAGEAFRRKYGTLYSENEETLPVFVAASKRVYDSAVFFTEGFAGRSYSRDKFNYVVISENISRGFNSLTPRSYCPAFDYEVNIPDETPATTNYRRDIRERLVKDHPDLALKESDIDELFNLCAFEINYQGYLSFCQLFTQDEFVEYGYQSDLRYYYSSGPGGRLVKEIGSIQLEAAMKLLKETNTNKIWLSFTHDTDIELFHAALGLFDTYKKLPNDRVEFRDTYHHSEIVPMGGRTILEKYACGEKKYVRFIINDAVIPIPTCSNGPGNSCEIVNFESYVNSRVKNVDMDKCENNKKSPNALTFYWDYKEHAYNDEPLRINP